MSEKPYSDADVELVAKAIGREYPGLRDAVAPRLDADARAILDALAAAGRLLPSPSERQWIFPMDSKIDALMADGSHRYWSTHCRHGHHGLCAARRIVGEKEDGSGLAALARSPAQCKTCSSPCICPCHTPPTINEESTDARSDS